jgi:protein-tyrosine phosphatase
MAQRIPAFVFEAEPETMRLLLARLDERWGGAAGYLTEAGVSEASLARWRELLVEPV